MAGSCLVWIVRPYAVNLFLLLGLVMAGVLTIRFMIRTGKQGSNGAFSRIFLVWVAVFAVLAINWIGLPVGREWTETVSAAIEGDGLGELPQLGVVSPSEVESNWVASRRLPGFIDQRFRSIVDTRERYYSLYPDAMSVIDGEISFHSVSDVVKYLPRAVQIALLSPFPPFWFEEGSMEASTWIRRVAGFEMVVVYTGLIGLVFTLGFWWRRVELWLAGLCSFGLMVPYAFAIPNLGTLYRMRFDRACSW